MENIKGIMRDLWNYRKLTGKERRYTSEDVKNRLNYSILIREYLCYNDFDIFLGSKKLEALKELRNSFESPVYPLTAGNSDDLLKIAKISEISEVKPEKMKQFEYTVLPGDISKAYKPDIDFNKVPITTTIYTPQVFLLPTKFDFNGTERRIKEKKAFTFVSSSITLQNPLEGYDIEGKHIILQ